MKNDMSRIEKLKMFAAMDVGYTFIVLLLACLIELKVWIFGVN